MHSYADGAFCFYDMSEINGYKLSRDFWDYAFENTGKIKPIHVSIYFFAIEHCNRLGWKKDFGLPTSMVLEAITVKSYSVYKSAFDDLVTFGFFEVVQYSKNQYSSNIIALKENCKANSKANEKANSKALDKAMSKHIAKQCQSTVSIDKQLTLEPINNKTLKLYYSFEEFWEAYGKKVDYKKAKQKYLLLTTPEKIEIFKTLADYIKSTPDIKFRKHASTYINNKSWENDYTSKSEQQTIADIGRQQLFAIFGNT